MNENDRLDLRGLKLDWSAGRTDHVFALVQGRLARRRRALRVAMAGGVLATVLSAGLFLARPYGANDAPASSARAPARAASGVSLELHDGSTVHRGSASTELRVLEETASSVRVELVRGSARFAVVPSRERSFEVRAGDVTVTVVGTEFSVEQRGTHAWVGVTRGKVRVAWGEGDERRTFVSAGEKGLFPPPDPPAPAAPLAIREAPSPTALRGDDGPAARARGASQLYRAHVAARDYPGAYAVLSKDPAVAGDTVEELLIAADVARLSNHPAQAVPYLERIVREHAADDRAPMAAFTLGRTLSALGRTREAMNMFGRVQKVWPRSTLGEDALVRQIEAASKLGELDTARRFAARYEHDYPKGRRRAEVRRYAQLD